MSIPVSNVTWKWRFTEAELDQVFQLFKYKAEPVLVSYI